MKQPHGTVYGSDWFRHIWSTNNHIPVIGEGMSMINLKGLRVEPVYLGIRFAPDQGPLKSFVTHCILDMADNHGSAVNPLFDISYPIKSRFVKLFSTKPLTGCMASRLKILTDISMPSVPDNGAFPGAITTVPD